MNESVIYAVERSEKPNQARRNGFVPGVIYGKGIESTNIKLDQKELRKLLLRHARNTKVMVKLGNDVRHCIIKEVQKDSVNDQILHVGLQAIHSDDTIRLKVPVVFQGKEKLGARQLLLQELFTEVEVSGKAADMPEFVSVDVEDKILGDKITVRDIRVGDGIKILDDENEIIAVVSAMKAYSEAS